MFRIIIVCGLSLLLSGCMVFNNASEIESRDISLPDTSRAIVFFAVKNSGPSMERTVVGLNKFAPGHKKLTASCFFDTYDKISAPFYPAPTGSKKYFAFSVRSGYYAYTFPKYPLYSKENGKRIIFKVEPRKVNYLGDFIDTGKEMDVPSYYTQQKPNAREFEYDFEAAKTAIIEFNSLKSFELVPAQQVDIDGQVEPVPFCNL